METKLVLLGTGTPNACPNASGPSSAVVVGNRAYLVDFGPGVVRQASKAYLTGLMHFALIFYALLFVPICTLITLPDIQILFLLHGCLNAIHHLRFLVQRDCVI